MLCTIFGPTPARFAVNAGAFAYDAVTKLPVHVRNFVAMMRTQGGRSFTLIRYSPGKRDSILQSHS
jgi:hypothetical protein